MSLKKVFIFEGGPKGPHHEDPDDVPCCPFCGAAEMTDNRQYLFVREMFRDGGDWFECMRCGWQFPRSLYEMFPTARTSENSREGEVMYKQVGENSWMFHADPIDWPEEKT